MTAGLLLAWALTWACVSQAVHARSVARGAAWAVLALAWAAVAAAFLWHVRRGE